jgi:hypothetical protein
VHAQWIKGRVGGRHTKWVQVQAWEIKGGVGGTCAKQAWVWVQVHRMKGGASGRRTEWAQVQVCGTSAHNQRGCGWQARGMGAGAGVQNGNGCAEWVGVQLRRMGAGMQNRCRYRHTEGKGCRCIHDFQLE